MTVDKIRFIGNYDFNANGKFLLEILCQLRGMGIGRYVTKNEWIQKWPNQPSYLKIIKVRPAMDRWLQEGKVWGEWIFRGKNLGIYEFSHDLNRSDWQVIHKHDEAKYLKNKNSMKDVVFSETFPLPPLQIYLMKKLASKGGTKWTDTMERAPLDLSIDPQFEMIRKFIKQEPLPLNAQSIYDEVDKEALLDLYGDKLPVKVEAWMTGPAEVIPRFHTPKE
uniref:28S ribosomal protein S34, mitochondrial n=1 Tax=Panagrolaimus superbus TaxID=310955 RepID=A0A914Z4N6_9BILA